MTKKDYILAAEIIRRTTDPSWNASTITAFVEFFRADNPRFDSDRFINACDPVAPTLQARQSSKPRRIPV